MREAVRRWTVDCLSNRSCPVQIKSDINRILDNYALMALIDSPRQSLGSALVSWLCQRTTSAFIDPVSEESDDEGRRRRTTTVQPSCRVVQQLVGWSVELARGCAYYLPLKQKLLSHTFAFCPVHHFYPDDSFTRQFRLAETDTVTATRSTSSSSSSCVCLPTTLARESTDHLFVIHHFDREMWNKIGRLGFFH